LIDLLILRYNKFKYFSKIILWKTRFMFPQTFHKYKEIRVMIYISSPNSISYKISEFHLGTFAKCFIFLFTVYNVFLIIITLVTQFFPIILDMVLPLDEPRPHKLLVTIECFVPLDKYFYIMVLHEFIIIILCFSMVLAMGTQLFVLTYHSFGMFRITR
jgi:hypothetical protein